MLVLTRKVDEEITLTIPPSDEERVIHVRVCKMGLKAKIGIQADREVKIMRTDMLTRLEESKR